MNRQTETQSRSETARDTSGVDTVVGFAALGMLGAGTAGILKALSMQSGFDVLLCLVGSVAAFGAVYYLHVGRR